MPFATQPDDAQTTLNSFLLGASVCGIRFGATQLLLQPANLIGECYINLSSAWHVYESRPDELPATEAAVPEVSEDQEILSLASLRYESVKSVEVVRPLNHLALVFSNGALLYVNGTNEGPEPWAAGFNALNGEGSVTVLALSGEEPIVYGRP